MPVVASLKRRARCSSSVTRPSNRSAVIGLLRLRLYPPRTRFHYRLTDSKSQTSARFLRAIEHCLGRQLVKHFSKVRMLVVGAHIHGAKKNIARTIDWTP